LSYTRVTFGLPMRRQARNLHPVEVDQCVRSADRHSVAMTVMIQVTGLTRRFGDCLAVDCLDLAVSSGEIFGLIGANGAGKSTVIRMLTTLLPPTSGRAGVAGYDIIRQPGEVRRHIGYVPQLLPPMDR
jgi:ABC-type multidrug transport system ATPase subunit